jgi:outer membrane PBP1 activator LpoA protein
MIESQGFTMFKLAIILMMLLCVTGVNAVESKNYTAELLEIEKNLLNNLSLSRERLELIGQHKNNFTEKEKQHYRLLNAHLILMMNDVDKAQVYLEELQSNKLNPDYDARKQMLLSSIYHHKGESVKAFLAVDRSLNLVEKLNHSRYKSKVLISAVGIYKDADLFEFALEYGRRAINFANESKDAETMCLASYEMGTIELLTKNYKMAENRLLTAKGYCDKAEIILASYAIDYSLMQLSIETGKVESAEAIARELHPKVEEYGWDVLRSGTKTLYGRLLLNKGELKEAKNFAEAGYQIAKNVKDKKRLEQAAALLAEVYTELKDNDKAVEYYKEYMELNAQNRVKIRQRKLAFDIARQERR